MNIKILMGMSSYFLSTLPHIKVQKRRSATAIRRQGSPQAHLLNGSALRQYDEVHLTQ